MIKYTIRGQVIGSALMNISPKKHFPNTLLPGRLRCNFMAVLAAVSVNW